MNKLLVAVAALVVILHTESVLSSCGQGSWTENGPYCYHVSPQVKTWVAAQSHCQTLKASLVKIASQEENDFVLALSQKFAGGRYQMWIGLHWKPNTKKFLWADGSQYKYQNWAYNEPNGREKEACGHMWTDPNRDVRVRLAGTWNDLACHVNPTTTNGFVCKKVA